MHPFYFLAQEDDLAKTIKGFQISGFPLTINCVCQLAFQFAHVNGIPGFSKKTNMAGRKWLKGFLNHHPQITLKTAKNLSIACVMGANETVITNWFSLLEEIKNKFNILSPCQIWSGDETRIQNVPKEVKVLGCKKIRTFQQVSGKQGETSMVLTFINATGQLVPPLIIHKGQCVQDTWQLKAPGNIKIAAIERGYITKSKFHEYGFIRFLKAHGLVDKTNLLIIDSHLYNLPFYEAMKANKIEIITIPPHTSHLLQALDSVPFAQFKKAWESNLMKYNNTHSDRVLNKVNFWDVFVPSWNSSITPKIIIAGFKKTGIYPHDPEVIPRESLASSLVTDRSRDGQPEHGEG